MTTPSWTAAAEGALDWIRSIATFEGAGFAVGPMPDEIHVLHPLERRNGGPALRWSEYASHRGVTDYLAGGRLDAANPLADLLEADDDMWPPGEGDIGDPATREALFDLLIRHTSGGESAGCTSYHPMGADPPIVRGPLGAWRELYDRPAAFTRSPQNLWPDSHEWVVGTDPDSWATAVSGTPDLCGALLSSPLLEVVRLR